MVASFSLSFSLVGLVGNLLMPIFGRLSISATVFLVMKTKTPCTTNSIISELSRVMAYRNSTNGQIRLNCMPSKPKALMFRAHSTFLPTIHCWNFFISKKMIFLLLERVTTIFSFFLSSHSILVQVGCHLILILNSPSSSSFLPSPCWCFLSSSPTKNQYKFLQHNNIRKREEELNERFLLLYRSSSA